ncbi:unnamed protein product [Caenorhabditis sp. 36 PRJEB53466]|nr:unnamed protein product [Caenorhabditis sp. 36 PRJEB53466]
MAQMWDKNDKMEMDDVWDDSELIKMYEQSIKEVNNQMTAKRLTEKKFTGEDGKEYKWKVGSTCMAPFEENGNTEYYAAQIDWIGDDLNVGVTFLFYGNEAVVDMKHLWENEEAVAEALELDSQRKNGDKQATRTKKSAVQSVRSVFDQMPSVPIPSFAPPVPPNIVGMVPAGEREALSSMLMSWYMSGYHTGYYQALADRKKSETK